MLLVAISALVFYSLFPIHVLAQGSNVLTDGEPVAGQITNSSFRTVYSFQGRADDIVDITLTRTDGDLDPMLILTDDQNNLIARDDDSAGDYGAEILSQRLPQSGTYFVVATRFGQERGLTTGGYTLMLSHVGSTANTGIALHYGDSVVAEITNEQPQVIYSFHASRGDVVKITMQRISGDLDSLLILADAQGNVIITNDEDPANPGTLDAGINNLLIEKTGTYILVATRFGREAGTSKGNFTLAIDHVSPDALGKTPDQAILMDYGNTVDGSIDNDTLTHYYMIEGRRGDVISVDVERTKGNLDPMLTLYSSDQKQLASQDSGQRGQNARISAFTIPADGNYILMVSRFNGDKGITAGDYALTVKGLHGVIVNSTGKTMLQYNMAASAIIDDTNLSQQYTFMAAAGDKVIITMDTTSGDLLVQLDLLDPNGKVVAQDTNGTGSARLDNLKLSAPGMYTIVATRYGRANGTTRGAYALTLTKQQ